MAPICFVVLVGDRADGHVLALADLSHPSKHYCILIIIGASPITIRGTDMASGNALYHGRLPLPRLYPFRSDSALFKQQGNHLCSVRLHRFLCPGNRVERDHIAVGLMAHSGQSSRCVVPDLKGDPRLVSAFPLRRCKRVTGLSPTFTAADPAPTLTSLIFPE